MPLCIFMRRVEGTLESLDNYVTEGVFWPGKCLTRNGGNPELEFTCHFSYAELAVSRVPKREGKDSLETSSRQGWLCSVISLYNVPFCLW